MHRLRPNNRSAKGFQSAPGFSAGRCRNPAVAPCRLCSFQSAPGFSAGRCSISSILYRFRKAFQSAPGFSAGRCSSLARTAGQAGCFNPLPAFQPGDAPLRQPLSAKANSLRAARTRRYGLEPPLPGSRSALEFLVFSKSSLLREPARKTTVASGSRTGLTGSIALRSPPPGTRRTASPAGGPIQ